MKKNQKNNDKEWKIKNEKLEMKITAYYQKIARETSIVFFRLKIAKYLRNNSRKVSKVS